MKRVTNSEEQKMKKSLIAILTTVVMILSMMAPLISTVKSGTGDVSSWYTSVNGVLSNDAYSLYPWATTSLNVGFSKFGELIGLPAGTDPQTAAQSSWVGLKYGGRDPFCPATVIPMTAWINGWYIDIQYTAGAALTGNKDRHVWAFALFSDGNNWGGDWTYINGPPGSNPGYGRQTNGSCVTDPLQVLYNGPREYIAMAVTHISDKQGTTTWPLLDLAITMVFDKDKKQVMLYKDVKLRLDKTHLLDGTSVNVCLSNREEYDLGAAPTYTSYAHYYWENGTTSYGPSYEIAQGLLRDNVTHLTGYGNTTTFTLPTTTLATNYIKVYVNGVFQDPSTAYTVNWNAGMITFTTPPTGDIMVLYKFLYQSATQWNGKYDIAQVISSDNDAFFGYPSFVAWTAMWPPVSDYTVDGMGIYLSPLLMMNQADCMSEPVQSPLIIGQWDFLLNDSGSSPVVQYRCVEVKGITANTEDYTFNYANDQNRTGGANVIGSEVQYQLDQIFKPQDLQASVSKMDFTRHVDMVTVSGSAISSLQLPSITGSDGYVTNGTGYLWIAPWTKYDQYVEKVLVNGTLWPRANYNSFYALNRYTISTTGLINFYTFDFTAFAYLPSVLNPTTRIKVLYSTFWNYSDDGQGMYPGEYEWMTVGRDAATVDSAGASLVSEGFAWEEDLQLGIAGADMSNPLTANSMPWVMSKWGGTGDTWADYYKSSSDFRTALKDDWCTYWPVASSSMIGVGGPLANMLAYYGNDFTTALYGLPQFSGAAYNNSITGVSCWNRGWFGTWNTYKSNNTYGYAVISTTVDLNGTVIFLVWGNWGRDTYYATQWLHGDAARSIAPGLDKLDTLTAGVTSIVLQISYPSTDATHPTFSVVECLGTVSETAGKYWGTLTIPGVGTIPYQYTLGGGIHDP
jgi:hypothetical protein